MPIAFLTTYPAAALLGRLDPYPLLFTPAVAAGAAVRIGFDARRTPLRQHGMTGDRAPAGLPQSRARVIAAPRARRASRSAVDRVVNEQVNRHFRRPRLINDQMVHPPGYARRQRLARTHRSARLNDISRLSPLAQYLLLLARSIDDDTYIDARAEDVRPR